MTDTTIATDTTNTTNAPKKIVLAVTAGIASYKAADLCSKLIQAEAEVRVAFSNSAHEFIRPLVFEALSGHPVYQHVFDTPSAYRMEHIEWARWADAIIIAPASADIIAKLAGGHANDAITTLYLAFQGQTYIAPSMNSAMLDNPATQANLATLSQRGVKIIAPGEGALACGETGSGRMAEPLQIMTAIGLWHGHPAHDGQTQEHQDNLTREKQINNAPLRPPDNSLEGKTILITSGPTREYLDPVRFISNPSSGRMGLALANEAIRRGAKVHFVTGPVDTNFIPQECEIHRADTAREMLMTVQNLKSQCDLFIFAAAVGDFRPAQTINRKIKRTGNSISLPLVENPDIAQAVGFSKQPGQITIGFAAETNDHDLNAEAKLERKHLDAVVINDVANPEIGFNSEENEVRIITTDGQSIEVPRRPKAEVAYEIFEAARGLLKS